MFIKKRLIQVLSYLYLIIPVILFLINWTKLYFSAPLVLLIIYTLYQLITKDLNTDNIKVSFNKKTIVIILILLIWVVLSGVGGLAWQNRWDHMFRNAIFNDLVNYSWPVRDFSLDMPRTLVYYFGQWLPSALIAKAFNSVLVGQFFLFIWTFIGVVFAILLIFNWLKKISLKVVLIFIFFSGLDIVAYLGISFFSQGFSISEILINLRNWQHLELILEIVNASSNTTLLFWLYNQIVPFWIGFMLILNHNSNKYLIFTFSLLILYSPFPAFALIPFIIYQIFKNSNFDIHDIRTSVIQLFSSSITIGNIVGFVYMLLVSLFFMSGSAVNTIWFFPFNFGVVRGIFIFLILEFAIFFPFMWTQVKTNISYWIIFITTILFSFVVLGKCCDFAWRTSIPLTYYTMLLLMKEVTNTENFRLLKVKYIIIILLLGAITPSMEIMRTVSKTKNILQHRIEEPFLSDGLPTIFEPSNPLKDLFIGTKESIFIKYIIK